MTRLNNTTRLGAVVLGVMMLFSLSACGGEKKSEDTAKSEQKTEKATDYLGEAEVSEYKGEKITWGLPTLEGTQSNYQDKFSQFVYARMVNSSTKEVTKHGTKYDEIVAKMGEPEEKQADDFVSPKGFVAVWGDGYTKVKIYFDDNGETDIMMQYADYPKDHWSKNKWLTDFDKSVKLVQEGKGGTKSEELIKKFGKASSGKLENGEGTLIWVNDKLKCAIRIGFLEDHAQNIEVGQLG
ncbi:hypothetical protein SAMN02745116_01033 [Pilibacter termitis]|uniref:DUF3862 domain-containing protein n=1 Tax=Pilibacter termitis TaxID=263852 RepID=A0A1T4MBS2_9ENTE|nr:hypothetical protein [Pilibacter termitis]SJZ64355.1 hypothetical protein SAMN02745116_01033 [Pilibacter termitis]